MQGMSRTGKTLLNVSEARTIEFLCKPTEEQKPAVDPQFIRGTKPATAGDDCLLGEPICRRSVLLVSLCCRPAVWLSACIRFWYVRLLNSTVDLNRILFRSAFEEAFRTFFFGSLEALE